MSRVSGGTGGSCSKKGERDWILARAESQNRRVR